MFTVFIIFLVIICVLLVMIVLVQNSKGGGLASNFSASNQYMGVRKTTDFLEKATWTLAAGLLLLSLVATWTLPKNTDNEKARVEGQFDQSLLNKPENNVINLPEGNQPGNQQGNQQQANPQTPQTTPAPANNNKK
jgi:preprotein translocase subunit SecG